MLHLTQPKLFSEENASGMSLDSHLRFSRSNSKMERGTGDQDLAGDAEVSHNITIGGKVGGVEASVVTGMGAVPSPR